MKKWKFEQMQKDYDYEHKQEFAKENKILNVMKNNKDIPKNNEEIEKYYKHNENHKWQLDKRTKILNGVKNNKTTPKNNEEEVLNMFIKDHEYQDPNFTSDPINYNTNDKFQTIVPYFNFYQNDDELTSLSYVYNPITNEKPHWLKIKIINHFDHTLIFNEIQPAYLNVSFDLQYHQIKSKSSKTFYVYNNNVDDEVAGYISYTIKKRVDHFPNNNYSQRIKNKLIVVFDELNSTCNVDIAATTSCGDELFRRMENMIYHFNTVVM